MKIVADESVDKQIVDRLRADGHDVVFIAELANSPPVLTMERFAAIAARQTRFCRLRTTISASLSSASISFTVESCSSASQATVRT